jgi:hypothetical protein
VIYNTIDGRKSVGKPKRRWIQTVMEDSKKAQEIGKIAAVADIFKLSCWKTVARLYTGGHIPMSGFGKTRIAKYSIVKAGWKGKIRSIVFTATARLSGEQLHKPCIEK